MRGQDDFKIKKRISTGVLYINIYTVTKFPRKIKVSKIAYKESYSSGKWRKRIGNFIYYYGNGIKEHFEEIDVDNPLFGMVFRKYLLDVLSDNITAPWQLKELGSTLRIVKIVPESYSYSNKISLQYEFEVGVHHWQKRFFGLIVDLKINIFDRENGDRISYSEIKDKYGESVSRSIWKSVQAFHKHLSPEGKKYATAMREKFNLFTKLLKECFDSVDEEKSFNTPDGEMKISFKPLEVVEVYSNDAI